jgi:hypothetical protein
MNVAGKELHERDSKNPLWSMEPLNDSRHKKGENDMGKVLLKKGDSATPEMFLNKFELGMLGSQNDNLRKMILNRGKVFSTLHNLWTIYNPKEKETHIISEGEWDTKSTEILMKGFGFTLEESNRLKGQYYEKLRGGIYYETE